VSLPLQALEQTVKVPTEAIIPIQNGKKMFIARNGLAQEVKVEAITRTDADAIITSGLKNGDTLIIGGVMSLRNGTPLQIQLKNKG
jgi:membrane fusion protein (multidrug efflux system)